MRKSKYKIRVKESLPSRKKHIMFLCHLGGRVFKEKLGDRTPTPFADKLGSIAAFQGNRAFSEQRKKKIT